MSTGPGPQPNPASTPVPPDPAPVATPPSASVGTPVPATEAERAQLRAELQELRTDVGDTVAELTERVDVPARVKAQTRQTVEQARQLVADKAPVVTAAVRERPIPAAAIAGSAVLVVIALLVRRRRSTSSVS